MTQKIHFASKWRRLVNIVFDKDQIPDVYLMDLLGFSPSSWKVWKPKFIECSHLTTCSQKLEETNEKIKLKIIYDKKQKLWVWKKTSITE